MAANRKRTKGTSRAAVASENVAEAVHAPEADTSTTAALPAVRPAPQAAAARPKPRLKIEVEWASITQTTGDVYVVGHYIGVLPQNAERALDEALSGVGTQSGSSKNADDSRLILTDLTRRGAVRGALGDIIFFPWKDKGQIVLAGMGRLGTFKELQLRTLAANLTQAIGRLLPNPTICTVLIGAGVGNLSVGEAVSGLISGASRTLESESALQSVTLRIVEYRLDRAYEILSAVREARERLGTETSVELSVDDQVIELDDTGGAIPIPFGFSMMLASLAQACFDGAKSPLTSSVEALTDQLPRKLRVPVREALKRLGRQRNAKQLGLAFRIADKESDTDAAIADRVSFSHDGARIHAAAITNLTTVSASTREVTLPWIDRFVESLRAPTVAVFKDRGKKALQTLVHPSLQEKLLLTGPLVLELDRTMARVPWELMYQQADQPLGVLRPVARQLRTAYSPRPSDLVVRTTWKALVIGNPDGSLKGSAAEAEAVKAALEAAGIEVTLRIGPPDVIGLGTVPNVEPADIYEILELLQTGDFDVVHYAGHARFQSEYPDRSGWLFKDDEVLTASKLEGVERAPRLIVANACVSAAVSTTINTPPPAAGAANGAVQVAPPSDAGVVASLADEFFRRGVADYIGTAWEVAEDPAKLFAEKLYQEFFAGWKVARSGNLPEGASLGVAVQRARAELFKRSSEFTSGPTVWAAYQHYGDPTRTLGDYRV